MARTRRRRRNRRRRQRGGFLGLSNPFGEGGRLSGLAFWRKKKNKVHPGNNRGGQVARIDGLALFTAASGATSMPVKLQGAIASSDTNIRDTTLSGFQVLGIGLKR